MLAALEAGEDQRAAGLTRLLQERADREARDLEDVLNALLTAIRSALDPPQRSCSPPERAQLDHDREAMYKRAEALRPRNPARDPGRPRTLPDPVPAPVPGRPDLPRARARGPEDPLMSAAGNVTRQHAEWLNLVDASGPFLSLPVLVRASPQGLDLVEPDRRARLRQAFEEWQAADLRARPSSTTRGSASPSARPSASKPPTSAAARLPTQLMFQEAGETLRPTAALAPDPTRPPALLIDLVPPGQDLDKYLVNRPWKASPPNACACSCGPPACAWAWSPTAPTGCWSTPRPGELASYSSTSPPTTCGSKEPLVLRAFTSLLTLRRLVGVANDKTLAALLTASARDRPEVTNHSAARSNAGRGPHPSDRPHRPRPPAQAARWRRRAPASTAPP